MAAGRGDGGREDVLLIVQADDLGMCHAVNAGVVRAFTEGIVTQASVMVPCPWFEEAAALARDHGIPVGMHETLTCEWDHLRWRPLTPAPSLRTDDGTFHRTLAAVRAHATEEDATTELLAQAERFTGAGLRLDYLDVHMGMTVNAAYDAVAAAYGVSFLYEGVKASFAFTSTRMMSERPSEAKRDWLLHRLDRIAAEPGIHLVGTHPATPSAELRAICKPDAHNAAWAEYYRASDLDLLCDPSIRARVDELGIRLVSFAEAAGWRS
ncbi:MAG TPA: ChbG/HpnK family deacetylase [Acidimicrobiales bacterium]